MDMSLPRRESATSLRRSRANLLDCRVIVIASNVPVLRMECGWFSPCFNLFRCCHRYKELRENHREDFLVNLPLEKCRPFMSPRRKMDGEAGGYDIPRSWRDGYYLYILQGLLQRDDS
ncbi:hypothetical protein GWK47_029344 [Chionoecetes opilio]|uniref:Uncharacterized protein n=1 Tax=Chionoecetes opilio TaxID=41210 RepID=A0A8J5CRK3_CHIOP|nr:hypothetical protein GWK47_029344 [Chionoecetes opilio]